MRFTGLPKRLPSSTSKSVTISTTQHKMEEDRAATNLGPEVDIESFKIQSSSPKHPRKRFIGRRAAGERAAAKAQENGDHAATEGTDAVASMDAFSDNERLNLRSVQLPSQLVLLARSIKSLLTSSTMPTSMPPLHISLETTTSRFTRPSTVYAPPAPPMSHSNSQKDFSSSRL